MRLLRSKRQPDDPHGSGPGDQAGQLRRLVASASGAADLASDSAADHPPMVVLLGAKGGVGTTTVAWQLTQALTEAGHTPLTVDAHLWQPDLARVAGIALKPGPTVADVVAQRSKPATAVQISEGPALMPGDGTGDPSDTPNANFGQQLHQELVLHRHHKKGLGSRFDTLVVDGGPGRSPWAESLLAVADLVLLIATPDHLATLGAYSLLKLATEREVRPPVRLVMNRCVGESHGRTAHAAIRDTCRQHLKTSLSLAGWLPHNATLARPAAPSIPLARPLCRRVREALGVETTRAAAA